MEGGSGQTSTSLVSVISHQPSDVQRVPPPLVDAPPPVPVLPVPVPALAVEPPMPPAPLLVGPPLAAAALLEAEGSSFEGASESPEPQPTARLVNAAIVPRRALESVVIAGLPPNGLSKKRATSE